MGSKAKNRLGTALEVTGGIVSSVGAFPGSGIIGGALSLGGKMLKPGAATKEDVKELQQAIDQSQGIVKKLLEEKLAEMMRMLESGEVFRSDWTNVKTEMMQILREVRVENGKMAPEVEIIKNVAAATYKMVESLRYKVQGVPQLSSHFVFVILLASTHPNCKSWGSFTKFRKFATK